MPGVPDFVGCGIRLLGDVPPDVLAEWTIRLNRQALLIHSGGFGTTLISVREPLSRTLVRVAADLQTFVHEFSFASTWPQCPHHPQHPMWPRVIADKALWGCTAGGGYQPVAEIGSLRLVEG